LQAVSWSVTAHVLSPAFHVQEPAASHASWSSSAAAQASTGAVVQMPAVAKAGGEFRSPLGFRTPSSSTIEPAIGQPAPRSL